METFNMEMEYKYQEVTIKHSRYVESTLNQMGADGWEAISVFRNTLGLIVRVLFVKKSEKVDYSGMFR